MSTRRHRSSSTRGNRSSRRPGRGRRGVPPGRPVRAPQDPRLDLYERAEERVRRLTTLSSLTRLMNSAPGSREVFDAVARAAATLLGARIGHLWVDDARAGRLRMEGEHGIAPGPSRRGVALPYGRGVVGAVFASRTPAYIFDVQECPQWTNKRSAREAGLHAAAEIPLVTGDRIVGVLSFLFGERRQFTSEEKELMGLLADHAAIAINNKGAEEALRHVHGETERLLASIAWVLVAVDGRGEVTRWNAAAEEAFGIPAARVLGQPFPPPSVAWDWARVSEAIARCRADGRSARLDDVLYTRAAGGDGYLSLTVSPIGGDGDPGVPILILGSDITERRLLQVQLAHAQKLESIGQLAAGVAHEINTPIQFVGDNSRFFQGAFADLFRLLETYRGLGAAARAGVVPPETRAAIAAAEEAADLAYLTEEIPRALAETLDGVGRVASIVRALRTFAHPDRHEPVLTDINQALESTLTVARSEVKHVAEVEMELGDLPAVRCHPGELNQVLLNLIVNGAHAIADAVGDSGRPGRLGIRTAREGDDVVIAISDTGTGIPAAVQPHVFEPFFTTKAAGRGTGQGLAQARSVVVDKHGGTLTFETEAGRGTTFFVRLPVAGPGRPGGGRPA